MVCGSRKTPRKHLSSGAAAPTPWWLLKQRSLYHLRPCARKSHSLEAEDPGPQTGSESSLPTSMGANSGPGPVIGLSDLSSPQGSQRLSLHLQHKGLLAETQVCSLQAITCLALPTLLRMIKLSCRNRMKHHTVRSNSVIPHRGRRKAKKSPVFFAMLWNASRQGPRGPAFPSVS